ncbi:PREDICTED: zinc finger CCHC domain-containing protein 9-like isoform X2 [Polistes canadensis]|uniref:zinc finger CCHC domain-containing protein 9-like isoform X2 n=1 Tax=Polistes canadensis TaxID=91411 RepID=UPI000718F554|nr:PREDICTED: zinc finger CCHC domain-containing protein 9-like isoform X2 [Polistes canadensis]
MTRYTRAKGAKASNERLPNDATPWHIMKQQLTENETTEKKVKTAKELLSEKQETDNTATISWANFDDDKSNKNVNQDTIPKKKEKKKHINNENKSETQVKDNDNSDKKVIDNENNSSQSHQVLSKRQKRNMKRQNKSLSDSTTTTSTNKEESKNNNTDFHDSKRSNTNYPQRMSKPVKKRKPPKIRDDLEHKRRKPDCGAIKMMFNGVEVEIVKYDGFPVKKEDAERLKELRQKMVMQGIPKSEIDSAMKLERRKAEKELARAKKHVCFHCRKSGHNLSDCPELANEQSGTGICYKCGSTEHTHFECKVNKAPEYRYATCFICREQGHISNQCPDNPRGIYPDGGACKICGDVTHLKKDCPDLIKEKEESVITVDKIMDGSLESLDVTSDKDKSIHTNNKTVKIVKF